MQSDTISMVISSVSLLLEMIRLLCMFSYDRNSITANTITVVNTRNDIMNTAKLVDTFLPELIDTLLT